MKKLKAFFLTHYKITGFLFTFLIIFINILLHKIDILYGDAIGYSTMSNVFMKQGLFNFKLNIIDETEKLLFALRGYAWPWIIALCKTLGGGTQIGEKIFYSLFLASGLGYALPELFEELFAKKVNWYSRVVPSLLTICFWNGLILYPLSDIPSVITVSFGLLFLCKVSPNNSNKENCCLVFLAGTLLGVSYYIRSGCKPIVFLAVIIILFFKNRKLYLWKFVTLLLFCIGIVFSMTPQIEINKYCNEKLSYEVPIFFTSGIADAEYYNGFKWLRYEVNVSDRHPETSMISYDKMFDNILAVEDIAPEDVKLTTVLSLFTKYPLELIGLYAAKFANLIDPRYGNQLYITDLNPNNYLVIIANFLIWFLIFLSWGLRLNEGNWKKNVTNFFQNYFLYIVAFLSPALIHLLGTHTESRYFYPFFVFIYTDLAVLCDWKRLGAYIKEHLLNVAIIGIAFFACLSSIWNFTFEQFNYSQVLIEPKVQKQEITNINFEKVNDFEINYDIWSFEKTDDNVLRISGYIAAKDRLSKESKLKLLLLSDSKQYEYDINLSKNVYEMEPYINSKFNINKQLVELEEGKYSMGFELENASDSGIIWTEYTVEVKKQN